MSKYIFIASDFEIPEVDLTNEQRSKNKRNKATVFLFLG